MTGRMAYISVAVMEALSGRSADAALRELLGLPEGGRSRPRTPKQPRNSKKSGNTLALEAMTPSTSITLPWVRDNHGTVTNARALVAAVSRVSKNTGWKLTSSGTPSGLRVTRRT